MTEAEAARTLKVAEGTTSQEIQAASRNGKGKETDPPLKASRRNQSYQYPDFSPVKSISDV